MPSSSSVFKTAYTSVLVAMFLFLLVSRAVAAPIEIAGGTYDTENFADTLISSAGSYSLGGAGTLAGAVTGSNVNSWAFSFDAGAYLELGFTNGLTNGVGNDLVLFEIGTLDNFGVSLTVGSTVQTITTVSTGFTQGQGFGINIGAIDLSLLGLAQGATIFSIVIHMDPIFRVTSNTPTLAAAVALHSATVPVPEPGTLALLGLGLVGMGIRRRIKAS